MDTGIVLVPVTVMDHQGKTVGGLQRGNFTLFDEQMPQRIVSFAAEDSPSSVGLVLDISGSMRNTLPDLKAVLHDFLSLANPEDEFFLLTVSTKPGTVSGFTEDREALEAAAQWTRAGGGTALIDTIHLALTRMHDARRQRRALLVLSDGVDNYSRYSKAELLGMAVEADTQIYTIAIDTAPMSKKPIELAQERGGLILLADLAERTGGLTFRVRNGGAAKEAVRKAAQAIRNEYVIGYRTPDASPSGKWHRIRVKADVPGTRTYARSGYYSR
jgi:Ca-activated chloride channel family protein